MNLDSFYTDHWREIEESRIARYDEMFVWNEGQRPLLLPAEIATGQHVLDIGSGPGFFAIELADMVGVTGQVDGVDINQRFVTDASARAADIDNLNFHRVDDHALPFADNTFDRVICKNVLEYVPDVNLSLREVHRVLKPGGRAHIIDSDWGFVIVEPWGKAAVDEFFAAAGAAFNEPHIGRKASGKLSAIGFNKVRVKLSPYVETQGLGMNVLKNMASYIEKFDSLPMSLVEERMQQVEGALKDGGYLFCLPQFLVTGVK